MANTMKKWEYIKEHIIWSLLSFLSCRYLLFRCIPNYSYYESLLILLVLGIGVMGGGIVFAWEQGRNYVNLTEDIVLSWSVYVIWAFGDIFKTKMMIIGTVTIVVSVILTVIILARRINRQNRKWKIFTRRIWNVIKLWRLNFVCASLIFMIPLSASMMLNGTIMNTKVNTVKIYSDEDSLDANIEMISNIAPERWNKLAIQQKMDVCQKIINSRGFELGLSHEIVLGMADLDDGVLAHYNEARHQIVMDTECLMNTHSYGILEILIHECTHAYQYEQVALYLKADEKARNLLLLYDASVYLQEFLNYEDGSKDFQHYYSQKAEVDARKAGKTDAVVYIQRVNEYLYGNADKPNWE